MMLRSLYSLGVLLLAMASVPLTAQERVESDTAADIAAEIQQSLKALEALASEENIRSLGESLGGLSGILSEENLRQFEEAIGANFENLGELASEENMAKWAEQMEPMYENMYSTWGKLARDRLSDPELAAALAAYVRNFYQALVQQGFDAADALEIVKSVPLPMHSY